MINLFEEKEYLSLTEFISMEQENFKEFIVPPLFATKPERSFLNEIAKIDKKSPGIIKYITNITHNVAMAKAMSSLNKPQVTNINNDRLFKIIEQICLNLNIVMPRVYTYSEQEGKVLGLEPLNACTLGNKENLNIYVGEPLIKEAKFTDLEIAALIGHEIGHALSNHSIKNAIIKQNFGELSKIIKSSDALLLAKLKSNNYLSRLSEISADRAAVLACRDIASAVSMIKKISVLFGDENWDYDHSTISHPNGKTRVAAMKLFAKSEMYKRCILQTNNQYIDSSANFTVNDNELQTQIEKLIK